MTDADKNEPKEQPETLIPKEPEATAPAEPESFALSNQEAAPAKKRGRPNKSRLDPYLDEIVRRLKIGIPPKTLADQCGVTRVTLYNMMEKHGINMHDLNKKAGNIGIEHRVIVVQKELDV